MAIDLTTAQAHLDAWTAADLALSVGQSYSIGSRTLTRNNAAEVRSSISFWQRVVTTLQAEAASNTLPGNKNVGVHTAKWS